MVKKPKVIVIVGQTASGKSDLAVKLARRYNGEVVSADSRQVYKGLDLGSGKITAKEMRGIPHHLLDVASPKRTFTAAQFRKLGRQAVKDILRRGKLPIIAGGTGFYIDSLIYDHPLPEVKPNPKLRRTLEKRSEAQLFSELERLDPERAANIDPKNKRRLVRALEIIKTTGRPVPSRTAASLTYETIKIGILRHQEELKKRIRLRLLRRLKQGLLAEVRKLHAGGVSWKRLDDLGLEYRYVSRHLRGLISKEEMLASIERESLQYAKRQMTWWKKDQEIRWFKDPAAALDVLKSL